MCKKVYVVIPVYNAERFLEKAVQSVLHKKALTTEIILIDDGSPDQSGRMCDKMAEQYPSVHVLHQENSGVSAARNAGIEYALSRAEEDDYIAFLDADDFWMDQFQPDPMERMDTDLIGYSCGTCNEKGTRFGVLHRFEDGTLYLGGANTRWINYGMFASFFYRAGMVRRYALRYLPGVRRNEDVIFWRQASFSARSVRFSSKILQVYRQNSTSVTHSGWKPDLHIPNAWCAAATWVDHVPHFSPEEKERWRLECSHTCGARLLETARIMVSWGYSAGQIRQMILDGPLGKHLLALEPEDLAQWQREDLCLIRRDIQTLIRKHRLKGFLFAIGVQMLRFPPVRRMKEWRQFPHQSLEDV